MSQRVRHKKRGSVYDVVGIGTYVDINGSRDMEDVYVREAAPGIWHVVWEYSGNRPGDTWARMQCAEPVENGCVVAIYRDADHVWVRPLTEFNDGRFEVVHPGDQT